MFATERFAGLFVTHAVTEAVFVATRIIVMSARPGRILADVPVPFGYPRQPGLRYTQEFAEVAATVSKSLREACEAAA